MTAFVTNAGLMNVMWAWSVGASYARYVGFGTGSGQGVAATELAAPIQTRELATTSWETTNVDGDTARVTATLTATVDTTISEVGVFDDASAFNMDIYGDFTGIDLAAGDAIMFTISVTALAA